MTGWVALVMFLGSAVGVYCGLTMPSGAQRFLRTFRRSLSLLFPHSHFARSRLATVRMPTLFIFEPDSLFAENKLLSNVRGLRAYRIQKGQAEPNDRPAEDRLLSGQPWLIEDLELTYDPKLANSIRASINLDEIVTRRWNS